MGDTYGNYAVFEPVPGITANMSGYFIFCENCGILTMFEVKQ